MSTTGHTIPEKQRTRFHYPDESIEHYLLMMNENTSLHVSETLRDRPTLNVGWMTIVFRPFSNFLKTYIVQKEYKNGFPGFVAATLASINTLTFYAKCWEYRMREREGKGFLPPVTSIELNKLNQL